MPQGTIFISYIFDSMQTLPNSAVLFKGSSGRINMSKEVPSFDVKEWIDSVKHLYESDSDYKTYSDSDKKFHGRLIPLCTPVLYRPSALVIGTNHSVFDEHSSARSELLANNYAGGNSENRHSLVDDQHRFGNNLRRLAARGGQRVGRDWVCTNRCAIQTGEVGIREFQSEPWHRSIQSSMDNLLFQLIGHLEPQNVILCGNYAAELIFGQGAKISRISPVKKSISFKFQDSDTSSTFSLNAIPVWHPSRLRYDPYAAYIRDAWQS